MISYYWVESEQSSGNNKTFTISNMNDKLTIPERELVKAIKEKRVELLNYHLNPNNNNKLTKLRTNIIIPEEKMFQGNIINKLMNSYMAGKYTISEHLNLINSLFNRERDAATNKFLERLIGVVRLYFSYMEDVDVKIVIKSEKRCIKQLSNANMICNNYLMTKIDHISNQSGLSTEFRKFKDRYEKDFQSYDFILILLKNIINTNQYRDDIVSIVRMLNTILDNSYYTYVGEQMDTQFCNDLLIMYQKSVYDNTPLNLTRLTAAERQAKAEESCKVFINGYIKYNDKLKSNRESIIQNIRAGGQDAISLMDTLDKLNSMDYQLIDNARNNNQDTLSDYESYLKQKVVETNILMDKIKKSLQSKNIGKAVKSLSTALDLSASALMDSASPAAIGAGAVIKCINSSVETDKLAEELTEFSVNNNFPNDISSIINKLNRSNLFVIHMILYLYDRNILNESIKRLNKKLSNPFKNRNAYYFELEQEYIKNRKEKLIRIDPFSRTTYENSYLQAMSDLMTIDNKNILLEAYNTMSKEALINSEGVYTDRRHLEKAWIPAYKIIMYDIKRDKIPNLYMENVVFWKLMEDIFVVMKLDRWDENRNETFDKYMNAFNKVYGTHFERSKDAHINLVKLFKDIT